MGQIATIAVTLATTIFVASTAAGEAQSALNNQIGNVAMAADGTVTVTYDARVVANAPPPLVLHADQRAYKSYVNMVGGLHPGENKPLYRSVGLVRMNDDQSLTVQWNGHSAPGLVLVEPGRVSIKPGDPDYTSMVTRVGGLQPGETKSIPAQ